MLFTATQDFSTVISVDSNNVNLVCSKGSDYDLTEAEHAAVERDLPGALKPKVKAKAEPKAAAKDA
jgi:hypothetical protein